MAFDPQGGTLASGSDDTTVKLWEVRSGKLLRTLEGQQDTVLAWRLIRRAGRWPAGVMTTRSSSGNAQRQAAPHARRTPDWVWSVAFDPQGGTLASGSDDKTVKLWEARSGKLLHTLEGHRDRSGA